MADAASRKASTLNVAEPNKVFKEQNSRSPTQLPRTAFLNFSLRSTVLNYP